MTLEERNSLIERHIPDIYALAGRISRKLPPCFDPDRLASAGFLAVTEASERYEPSAGDFWSFVRRRAAGAMLNEVSREWKHECHVELPVVRVSNDPNPEELAIEAERRRRVSMALTGRQRAVLRLRILGGKSREIGDALGISKRTVDATVHQATKRIRQLAA